MSARSDTGTYRLRFPQLGRVIAWRPDETVLRAARRNGLRLVGACGGRGTCGACAIRIIEGEFRDAGGEDWTVGNVEDQTRNPKKWVRACRVTPHSDCTIEVAPRSLAPVVRAEASIGPTGDDLPFDPAVKCHEITAPPATLQDNRSDVERVLGELREPVASIDVAAARALPDLLRENRWSIGVRICERRISSFAAPKSRLLGLAVDLGTTNAAGFLVDLRTGRWLAGLEIENPQVAWGADVVSRIDHAICGAERKAELRGAAIAAIDALAHDLCLAVGGTKRDIVEAVVCGNTVMQHLLLGLPVRQLGRAPFIAALNDAIDVAAADFPLAFSPGAHVHVAANIGGFVGSDHVATLLATRSLWSEVTTAVIMDIGTNTEISLVHQGEILSASCPSGPALEGGHIVCGMRAAEGAIERVRLVDGRLAVDTMGGKPAVGICGSGVIDTIANLRRAGILDERGRIHLGHPDITESGRQPIAVLAPDVTFAQADVRAVQLARAAIMTGLDLLLRKVAIDAGQIERFVVAGTFGAYIDPANAIEIGLFPALPTERIIQVGNAAGVGVTRMLASRCERQAARDLARHCRYVELSSIGDFQKRFMHNIRFASRSREDS